MYKSLKIIVYLLCMHSMLSFGQRDSNVVIHFPNVSMKISEVLEFVSSATGYEFSYNPSTIPLDSTISFSGKDIKLNEFLEMLHSYNISSQLSDQHIILKTINQKPKTPVRQFFTISGYLKDAENSEALIGANVIISETGKGTTTNGYGFFSLNLPEDEYELLFSYLGYSIARKEIILKENINIDIGLEYLSTEIEEVKIISDEFDRLNSGIKQGKIELPVNSIRKMPGFLGESDIIKSLHSLPGISFYSDGSTIFHVRGGARDQNLLLIDEAPVYNPAHLLGIFSVFTPDALNSVDVYKGDMPAKFGGRLSSVIDVKMKEGNGNRFVFSGNTSPVATTLNMEAPLINKKGSFYISGRRSHLKWILNKSSPNLDQLYFTDLNIKTNYRLNEKNRLFFSIYAGVDKFRNRDRVLQSSGISWLNAAANIRWNTVIKNSLFVNTSLIFSQYDYNLYTSYELNNRWNSSIGLSALKSDFSWYINPENTLKFGFYSGSHRYFPGNFLSGNKETPLVAGVPEKYTSENAIYVNAEMSVGPASSISYGFRLVRWANRGPGYEFVYNLLDEVSDTLEYQRGTKYNSFISFEPRIRYTYRITKQIQGNLSLSRNTQFEHLISNSISPFTSLEVWLPAGPNIKPITADQVSAGFTWKSGRENIYFNADFFFKKMSNYISYTDHAYMLFNPNVDRELLYGSARAYGGEFIIKKTRGKWDGWVSYVYTRTLAKISEINDGNEFPARYDRPHTLSAYLFYQAKPGLNFSMNWIYSTGAPFTTPTGYYYYNGYQVPYYGTRNNDRLPDYRRMDVACEIRLNKPEKPNEHLLKISVFNFFGWKNPFSINFNKILDDAGNIIIPANYYNSPDYTTTMMYIYSVIPSVSYHFKF